MLAIQFPDKKPQLKKEKGRELVFCIIRKRWVLLTPEEWVRQNFLFYLTEVLHYPHAFIAVEKKIKIAEVERRFDILVYDQHTLPFIIVECKKMSVPLSEEVMMQVLRYNVSVGARFLLITNGSFTYGFEIADGNFTALTAIEQIQHRLG
jgi:hypothetical protein